MLEKTLGNLLDCKEIKPVLKEINPEYLLEGLTLKLKLQYFGYLTQTADTLKKTLVLGKTEGKRRWWQRMRWLDSITNSMDMNLSQLREIVKDEGSLACCSSWDHKESDTTQGLNNHSRFIQRWL